nr:putative 2-oxoglutarate-dependent dioxygenase [Quercus suber]
MQESAFKVKKYVEISYRKKNFCASKHKSFLPTALSRSSFQIPRESASSGLIRSYMIKATNTWQKKDALDIYRSHLGHRHQKNHHARIFPIPTTIKAVDGLYLSDRKLRGSGCGASIWISPSTDSSGGIMDRGMVDLVIWFFFRSECSWDDSGVLTILNEDDVGGLEVKRKTDGEWVRVKSTPDAYIINIGDTTQVWTNDEYESVKHRVVVNSEKERFSIAFFLHASSYTMVMVEPLEELTSEQNPAKYRAYSWGKFITHRKRSNFQKLSVENVQISHFRISK